MRNTTLLLLVLGVVLAYRLQDAEAQISFSLPGKWGHKRSSFKFALPGKWGSILKRNAGFGFSLPGQWAGKRSGEYVPTMGGGTPNDIRGTDCDMDTLNVILEMYDFIRDRAAVLDRCVPHFGRLERPDPAPRN